MSIEIAFSAANLLALAAYALKLESRLSRLEAMVELLIKERIK